MNSPAIPPEEKVFSLFEPHTEWISKGKAEEPVEWGWRVCVREDSDRFILSPRVMERGTDDQVAVPRVKERRERFARLRAVSMDKGVHSPANQQALAERLERGALPKSRLISAPSSTTAPG